MLWHWRSHEDPNGMMGAGRSGGRGTRRRAHAARPIVRIGVMAAVLVWGVRAMAAPGDSARDEAPPEPNEASAREDAERRFQEGLERVARGDYAGGRLAFAQAYAVLKSSDVLFNLALSELKSGHTIDGLRHFRELLHDPKLTDADRHKAAHYIEDASRGTLYLIIDAPAGALIAVDGERVGTAPLEDGVDLAPGRHVIVAKLAGARAEKIVDADAGAQDRIDFSSLGASSGQRAPIVDRYTDPPEDERHGGGPNVAKWVTVAGLGVGSAAAFVAGGLFGSASTDSANEAAVYRDRFGASGCAPGGSAPPDACRAWSDAVDAQDSQATLSRVFLWGVGPALAVTAVTLAIVWPERSGTKHGAEAATLRPRLVPLGSESGAGAAIDLPF